MEKLKVFGTWIMVFLIFATTVLVFGFIEVFVPWVLVVAAIIICGWFHKNSWGEPVADIIYGGMALTILYIAVTEGYYWQIFERGRGWFTANRVSFIIAMLIAFFAVHIYHSMAVWLDFSRAQTKSPPAAH